jgi:hypothetical protein
MKSPCLGGGDDIGGGKVKPPAAKPTIRGIAGAKVKATRVAENVQTKHLTAKRLRLDLKRNMPLLEGKIALAKKKKKTIDDFIVAANKKKALPVRLEKELKIAKEALAIKKEALKGCETALGEALAVKGLAGEAKTAQQRKVQECRTNVANAKELVSLDEKNVSSLEKRHKAAESASKDPKYSDEKLKGISKTLAGMSESIIKMGAGYEKLEACQRRLGEEGVGRDSQNVNTISGEIKTAKNEIVKEVKKFKLD